MLGWDGSLQPATACETYRVHLSYRLGWHPQVTIRAPELEPNEHGILPHFYPDSGTLCLYDPMSDEWTSKRVLADTILPWTATWLINYEIWTVTRVWHGSGDDMAWAQNPGLQPLRAA